MRLESKITMPTPSIGRSERGQSPRSLQSPVIPIYMERYNEALTDVKCLVLVFFVKNLGC